VISGPNALSRASSNGFDTTSQIDLVLTAERRDERSRAERGKEGSLGSGSKSGGYFRTVPQSHLAIERRASGLLDCQGVGVCWMIQAVGNELANWRLHELFEMRDDHVYAGAMAGACGPSVSM
jgi:hypothetical protein